MSYQLSTRAAAAERKWAGDVVASTPRRREARMITEIPGIERPGADLLQVFGLGDIKLPSVTIGSALTVPAVAAAVAFLPRSLAALPLHAYRKTDDGPQKISGGLETLIHDAPNREWTSFKLRQYFWQQVFTGGRDLHRRKSSFGMRTDTVDASRPLLH